MIVVPSSDLRNRYTELTEEYLPKGESIYLTKNGRGHAVLLSIEEYERLSKADVVRKIEEGIREAKAGNVMTVEETASYIRKELGI